MSTPESTAPSEARLRHLSRDDLAAEMRWYRKQGGSYPTVLLVEFRRRFWDRCEESALHGTRLSIPPRF